MSEKTLYIFFVIAVFFCCAGCLPVSAENPGYFSGGTGTVADPYQISTPSDLMNLSWTINNWADYGKYTGYAYLVTAPLDMSGISEWRPIGIPDYEFPTNNYSIFYFRGTFDGNYQQITGLHSSTHYGSGLFSAADKAILKNIRLENVSLEGQGLTSSASQTLIENCSVSGSVSGGQVGGLLNGGNSCKIVNCSVTGSVTGARSAGGLAGVLKNTTVQNCVVSATVTSGRVVDDGRMRADAWEGTGGLIGSSFGCNIEDSFFSGNVTSEGNAVGGLAGETAGDSYIRCSSVGNITGESCVGGLAGYAIATTLSDCFAAGDVLATEDGCGGFVGKADPKVSLIRCYAAGGQVSGQHSVGGLAGWMEYGTVTDCLVLHQSVTGLENVSVVIGRSSTQWPVLLQNVSVWEDIVVLERDNLLNLSEMVVPVSSADVWNDSPEMGVWVEFPSDVWKQEDADGYGLLVLDIPPEMIMPDMRYLNSSTVPPKNTESPSPIAGLFAGICLLGFLNWRKDRM